MSHEISQASNLEFMIRYGFKVENNPWGGRQFELVGEPLQSYCPALIPRFDPVDEVLHLGPVLVSSLPQRCPELPR